MKKAISLAGAFVLPFVALAADATSVLTTVSNLLNLLTPILITLAVLYFFWGLIGYLMGDVTEKEKGRTTMIWGIITIFVMVAVFGLVQLIGTTFGVSLGGSINTPTLPRI